MALVLATRLITLLAAPVTLYLVATRRSPAEQGFYFVLVNMQALASLVELGAGTIVVQFIAHESPSLAWSSDGALAGDAGALARALGVVRQGWRWYGRLAALVLVAVPVGPFAFGHAAAGTGVPFGAAWAVVIVATAAYFPLVPPLCALEGAHGLVRVQQVRLMQAILSIAALWAGLVTRGALVAVAMFALTWLLVPALWLVRGHRAFIVQALRAPYGENTLASVQWRTGSTWLILWASPQLLVQIVLAVRGAADAGRVGMSLAIATAPVTLASAWLQSRYPRFAATLTTEGRAALDTLAKRSAGAALAVCAVGGVAVTAVAAALQAYVPRLGLRLLPAPAVAALCLTGLGWLAIHAFTAYLRADRDEPLLGVTSLGVAISVAVTAVFAARSAVTATLAYSVAVMAGTLPLVAIAFWAERSKRIRRQAVGKVSADV